MAPKQASQKKSRSPKRSARRASKSRSRSRRVSRSRSKSQRRSVSRRSASRSKSKGKARKWQVLAGTRNKTTGGLKADDLRKNKHGKVVSKKKHALSKQRAQAKGSWIWCVKKAREDLKITGFMPLKKGTPLYIRAKLLFNNGGNAPEVKKAGSPKKGKSGKGKPSESSGWGGLGC